MKITKVLIAFGIVSLIGGFALIVSGKLWGIVLFVLGISLGLIAVVRARKSAGYDSDDVFFNGIASTGRQQSEVTKLDQNKTAAESQNIWDAMEKSKTE